MELFSSLGTLIRQDWKKANYAEAAFPEIACARLEEAAPGRHLTRGDILRWATTASLPPQLESEFGNPITVFHDPYFFIDVLSWIDGSTAVHEHKFTGAFGVLEGSSIHTRYAFRPARALSERLLLGRVEMLGVEMLKAGDVRPIHAGEKSAHSLFHLDRPSLSVVIRTPHSSNVRPQYSYLLPSIAYDEPYETIEHRRCLRALKILDAIEDPDFVPFSVRLVRAADPFSALRYLRFVCERLSSVQACDALLAEVSSAHPELVAELAKAVPELRRTNSILLRRGRIRDAKSRWILGILLAAPTRKQLLEIVAGAHPGQDPVDVLVGWARELSNDGSGTEGGALAISFDDTSLLVFSCLLRGLSDEQVLEQLGREYDLGGADGVRELVRAMRESVLFGRLLAAPSTER